MRELALRVHELIAASDQFRQAMAAALGVSLPDSVAMGHLYHSGQLTPTMIAERLGMTTASVTGLLDRMAAAGLLTRSPNPRDRRSILVTLTEDGRRAARASFELFAEDIELAMVGTEPAERACLQRLIERIAAALHHRVADPNRLATALATGPGPAPAGGGQDSTTP